MIEVLHLMKSLNLAGSTRSIFAMAPHLTAMGVRQSLVSLEPALPEALEIARNLELRVIEEPSHQALGQELERADIVRVEWWNNPSVSEWLRAALPPARLLLYIHVGGAVYPHPITPELVDFADFLVTGCPYTRDHGLLGALDAETRSQKTAVVFATFDRSRLEGFRPEAHEGFHVSYIGMLEYRKMHPDLVAMSAAAKIPDVRFILHGKGSSDALRQRVRELGARERFRIGGYLHDIRPVLARSDVFGYPLCIHPGAELAVQEAMFAGIPPVVFPMGGLRDLVTHEYNGLVVESPAQYTAALEYLYHHPEERARLGENARHFTEQVLDAKRSARQLRQIYEGMMAKPKRARAWPGAETRTPRGSELFLDSLGADAEVFQISKTSRNLEAVLGAEVEIGGMRLGSPVLKAYARAYPEDGYLNLWTGLVFSREGAYEKAAQSFRQASKFGVRHWRVSFYLAQVAERQDRFNEAHKLCQKVLEVALNFGPAYELLRRAKPFIYSPEERTLSLFSYPRSGNTWLRFVIETLSGRPTISPDNLVNDLPMCERFPDLAVDRSATPAAHKFHRRHEMDETDLLRPLVVVVRNYKECIIRNRYDQEAGGFNFSEDHRFYLEPLRLYHHFEGRKLLFYYEDLIQLPHEPIFGLASLLGLSDEKRDHFLAHYEAHFQKSLKGYPSRSRSGGNKKIFHSQRLTPEQRREWDREMRETAPEIYDRYLSRYAEH